jgi:hypothetical protein
MQQRQMQQQTQRGMQHQQKQKQRNALVANMLDVVFTQCYY